MKQKNSIVLRLINWRGLSLLLDGDTHSIRGKRKNVKYSKEIESLEKHLQNWAEENKIDFVEEK